MPLPVVSMQTKNAVSRRTQVKSGAIVLLDKKYSLRRDSTSSLKIARNPIQTACVTIRSLRKWLLILLSLHLEQLRRVKPRTPKPISQMHEGRWGIKSDPRHISGSTLHRNKIPTATPLFSGSSFSKMLTPTSYHVT